MNWPILNMKENQWNLFFTLSSAAFGTDFTPCLKHISANRAHLLLLLPPEHHRLSWPSVRHGRPSKNQLVPSPPVQKTINLLPSNQGLAGRPEPIGGHWGAWSQANPRLYFNVACASEGAPPFRVPAYLWCVWRELAGGPRWSLTPASTGPGPDFRDGIITDSTACGKTPGYRLPHAVATFVSQGLLTATAFSF